MLFTLAVSGLNVVADWCLSPRSKKPPDGLFLCWFMDKSWSSTGHITGIVLFKHQQTAWDTIMRHHSRSERTSLFKTGEEWRASGTAGSATDLAVAHSNEGANCHTLQVAAGNLQRGEKQAEAGHKQRLLAVGGRRRQFATEDETPPSVRRAARPVTRSQHTVIISRTAQIITRLLRRVGRESVQSVARWGFNAVLHFESI